jgi:hypothetical protein
MGDPGEKCGPRTTSLVVIAGLDPAIPADSGVYGDARIKSEHDEGARLRPPVADPAATS